MDMLKTINTVVLGSNKTKVKNENMMNMVQVSKSRRISEFPKGCQLPRNSEVMKKKVKTISPWTRRKRRRKASLGNKISKKRNLESEEMI